MYRTSLREMITSNGNLNSELVETIIQYDYQAVPSRVKLNCLTKYRNFCNSSLTLTSRDYSELDNGTCEIFTYRRLDTRLLTTDWLNVTSILLSYQNCKCGAHISAHHMREHFPELRSDLVAFAIEEARNQYGQIIHIKKLENKRRICGLDQKEIIALAQLQNDVEGRIMKFEKNGKMLTH